MSAPISHDIVQLQKLNIEIKRKQKEIRELKDIKEQCEERIQNYLDSNDLPGIKHKGITILAEERQKRKYLKKSEKQQKGAQFLESFGIVNTKETLDSLLEVMRGSPERKTNLRIL